MKRNMISGAWVEIQSECFGQFRFEDLVCRKHCALRMRCAIEKDQKMYLEVFEELDAGDDVFLKFQ